MHRVLKSTNLRPSRVSTTKLHRKNVRCLNSSSHTAFQLPNEAMHLDPSLRALLKDADMSLHQHKKMKDSRPLPRELEAIQTEPHQDSVHSLDGGKEEETDDTGQFLERKSPAAAFGSDFIGEVVLPTELKTTIKVLIEESNKRQIHNDAKRLFMPDGETSESGWNSNYDTRYRNWKQKDNHAERDGTAFATVALPAHYSAISSVLGHIKHRLEPEWCIRRVIEWGPGAGAGLWACLHNFQQPGASTLDGSLRAINSTLESYVGIDKREGLTHIAQKLLKNIQAEDFLITKWQKAFHDSDKMDRSHGKNHIALSAFALSSLSNDVARKTLVKEMWQSGAEVMVLIDHSTQAGFEAIAEARADLLNFGKRELKDPETETWDIRGSHVVAPCPHDGSCPLYRTGSTKLVCGFEQRLQRPDFVRRTKHSKVGHEDIGYSYVVIRRGARPAASITKVGRIGQVGKRAAESEALKLLPIRELSLHDERDATLELLETEALVEATEPQPSEGTAAEVEEKLRLEAYHWPRLVFPPLKRSGHIILDSCTPEGEIMRLTIPRSQGKQPFYDARKSSWGDIFPHEPKNAPQTRYRTKAEGQDIGKRGKKESTQTSYGELAESIKSKGKERRRDRIQRRMSKDSEEY